jgi:hypothetical protein
MLGVLLIAAVLCAFGVGGWPIIAAGTAVEVFAKAFAPGLGESQLFLLDLLALAMPLSAWIAGALVERAAGIRGKGELLSPVAMAAAFYAVLSSDALPGFIESALHAVRAAATARLELGFLSALGGAVIFCSAAIALALSASVLIVELPARWVLGAASSPFAFSFSSLRLLIVLAAAGFSANLAAGLLAHELWPATILAAAGG